MAEAVFSLGGKRIWIAGHRGMVGSALLRRLGTEDCEILTAPESLDLRDQRAAREWISWQKPDAIVIAAAKVGGIFANGTYPADFLYDNLMIATNVIESAHRENVDRLLFLGSSCIYPRLADQPLDENALLAGPLEPTNQWYAIAKIAGIKLTQAFSAQHGRSYISATPANLYGPGDNYHPEYSHVLPALIRKAHDARASGADAFEVWGSGAPRREFLHVDDLAEALVHLLVHYDGDDHVNIGTGEDIAIAKLARLVAAVVGFEGGLYFNTSRPDGTPRKLLDSSKMTALGWRPSIGLRDGIAGAYADFLGEPHDRERRSLA